MSESVQSALTNLGQSTVFAVFAEYGFFDDDDDDDVLRKLKQCGTLQRGVVNNLKSTVKE